MRLNKTSYILYYYFMCTGTFQNTAGQKGSKPAEMFQTYMPNHEFARILKVAGGYFKSSISCCNAMC